MQYTTKYFRDNMPDWKKKKDPIICRILFRPISFIMASFFANLGITANIVSIFSTFIGIFACVFFALPMNYSDWIGCGLICLWLLLDCVDGNLARSMRQQPFGEFVDAMSSYILVGLLGVSLGFSCCRNGGIIFEKGNYIIILVGAIASSSDTLMRLIYQKYRATAKELEDRGIIQTERDVRTEHKSVSSIRVRVEMELGIAGIIPILAIICTATNSLDILVIYMVLYYGCSCIFATVMYTKKTLKYLDVPMHKNV